MQVNGREVETPMLDKLQSVQVETEAIAQFLEWLRDTKKLFLAEYNEGLFYPYLSIVRMDIHGLLGEYFELNMQKAGEEQRAILEAVRLRQEK
jgi:ferritin-like protein